MSIDKSLRRKNTLERARNVLTRGERIKVEPLPPQCQSITPPQ